jgi:hypothetical protein
MADKRSKITDVFTPRSAEVNHEMYIHRPQHERDLKRSVDGSLHTIVCGESGSGKSWLYKKVAETEGWKLFNSNAANAVRKKSLTQAIADATIKGGNKDLAEYSQKLGANVGAFGFGGGADATRKYEVKKEDLLLHAFKAAREQSGSEKAVVVVDNLEAMYSNKDLMEELGNIVLLLDDSDYDKYKIKFLIVGVPAGVIEYFQSIENLETISNRLQEVRSLESLSRSQIEDFIKRGFVEHLLVPLGAVEIGRITSHVNQVTLGIPQRLHEFCQILAYEMEENGWTFDSKLLPICSAKYLNACLRKAYAVVDGFMNERKTRTGRRNQVLYSLGLIQGTDFDAQEVENMVRKEFPASTDGTKLAVGQMLSELCVGTAPLLRRISKSANYRFADPRYLMCLRIMLRKSDTDDTVIKLKFRR